MCPPKLSFPPNVGPKGHAVGHWWAQKLAEQLELCQKSLTGYLATKCNAFPRFYFCSDGTILEILSQGSDPHAVVPHLQNVFDSTAGLTFDKQKKYMAVGLVANDKEEVPFTQPFTLQGNVEDYLCEVVKNMQNTISALKPKAPPMRVKPALDMHAARRMSVQYGT